MLIVVMATVTTKEITQHEIGNQCNVQYMTPVTEILTLLKILFSPLFIINVCQNFNS